MGTVHRASEEWKRLLRMRSPVERWFSSDKQSRLLDKRHYLGLQRVRLHARLPVLGPRADGVGAAEGRGLRQDATDAHTAAEGRTAAVFATGTDAAGVLLCSFASFPFQLTDTRLSPAP